MFVCVRGGGSSEELIVYALVLSVFVPCLPLYLLLLAVCVCSPDKRSPSVN